MAGTSEGGKKAALTRGHKSLSEAGRKGGRNSHLNRQNKSLNKLVSQSKSSSNPLENRLGKRSDEQS